MNKLTTYVLLLTLTLGGCDSATAKERCLRGNEGQSRARYSWIPSDPKDVPMFGLADNYGTCTVATGSRG